MTIVLFATLIWQVVDFVREVAGGQASRSSLVTQLSAWVVGILAVWIGGQAEVTEGLAFPGVDATLGSLDGPSIILVGLLASSLASSLVDIKQAIDGRDTAAKPALIPRSASRPDVG